MIGAWEALAAHLTRSRRSEEAARAFESAIEIQEAALALAPGDAVGAKCLARLRRQLWDAWLRAEQCERLAAAAAAAATAPRELLEKGEHGPPDAEAAEEEYRTALVLAGAAATCGTDERLAEEKRRELAEACAREAVRRLRASAVSFPKTAAALEAEPALQVLRGRDDFRALLEEISSCE